MTNFLRPPMFMRLRAPKPPHLTLIVSAARLRRMGACLARPSPIIKYERRSVSADSPEERQGSPSRPAITSSHPISTPAPSATLPSTKEYHPPAQAPAVDTAPAGRSIFKPEESPQSMFHRQDNHFPSPPPLLRLVQEPTYPPICVVRVDSSMAPVPSPPLPQLQVEGVMRIEVPGVFTHSKPPRVPKGTGSKSARGVTPSLPGAIYYQSGAQSARSRRRASKEISSDRTGAIPPDTTPRLRSSALSVADAIVRPRSAHSPRQCSLLSPSV